MATELTMREPLPQRAKKAHFYTRNCRHFWGLRLLFLTICGAFPVFPNPAPDFAKEVQPVLAKYCYDCHGDGMSKGQVSLDEFKSSEEMLNDHDLWFRVLKNVRAGVMPPEKKPHPTAGEKLLLERWIKTAAFRIDPANPDQQP